MNHTVIGAVSVKCGNPNCGKVFMVTVQELQMGTSSHVKCSHCDVVSGVNFNSVYY